MTEKLPALQGVTTSEILKHLDAMHSARKAFVKCEADEKICRALRHLIRATVETFNPGDSIFYKKEGKKTDGLDLVKLFFKMAGLFL